MPRGGKSSKPTAQPTRSRPSLRPLWTGHLKLSLVTVPVVIVSATASEPRLSFHQVHAPSGKRIKYDKVVPGVGSVEAHDIQKGYEVSKGRYILFKPEEIDDLKIEEKKTLEIVQSVGVDEIDPIWFEKPYYVLPDGDIAKEPYAVIREALRNTKRVGIGQFVMRGRDYIGALKPYANGMLLETLRFHDEVKSADEVFVDVETPKPERELLDLASELLKRKAAPYNPELFEDRYESALRNLIELRSKGTDIVDIEDVKRPEAGGKVIDLVEALKRSVAAAKGASAKGASAAPQGATGTTTPGKPGPKSRKAG
jgi:DNA end-binding protein Ku